MSLVTLSAPSVAALFAVPRASWDAINGRISTVSQASSIAEVIANTLPHFPVLVTECQTWKTTTYPTLITWSSQVASLSAAAVKTLIEVQDILTAAGDGPMMPATITQIKAQLGTLRTPAASASTAAANIAKQIAAFATANAIVDSEVESHIGLLGPDWQFLGATMAPVEAAAGLVAGGWSAILDDLDSMVDESLPVSPVLSLEIEAALNEWGSIGNEANAFPSLAPPPDVSATLPLRQPSLTLLS